MSNGKVVPFNPLDKRQLGVTVAQALLKQPVRPLSELKEFIGSGVYVLYYIGDFPAYHPLARVNREGKFRAPIYAGSALPKGGRKGAKIKASATGTKLFSRLKKHCASIEQVNNLSIDDFYFRALVVDDIWIPLGESLLIASFAPIWNTIIDGFGNHDPGKGRYSGMRPRWDVLHPGRPWAEKCQPRNESAEHIQGDAIEFLRNNPPRQELDPSAK